MAVTPFEVFVAESDLVDLRRRLRHARWPDQVGEPWEYGTDTSYLRELCRYWEADFDWRSAERAQNEWPQFTTTVDGQRVHFFHVRSRQADALPLLMVHGWPSSPLEFLRTFPLLTDPSDGPAFDLVVPSIPGYGWSGPTSDAGWSPARIAGALAELMQRLGYDRFGAVGCDMGSLITSEVARQQPDRMAGLYLTLLQSNLRPREGELTQAEADQVARNDRLRASELGYVMQQSTKPQTLAYGLNDSPVGQAAWIVEKFRTWSDCEGDVESVLPRDEILASISTTWFTQTAGSSARLYFEIMRASAASAPALPARVEVPTGVGVFPKELYPTSRRIAEDHFAIEQWTLHPRGGHFPAWEQPVLLVDDLGVFFSGRR